MNLYLISQNKENGYDTYDSAVVAAPDEQAARSTHPGDRPWPENSFCDTWCSKPEQVVVELLGKAKTGTEAGVICASFNAG